MNDAALGALPSAPVRPSGRKVWAWAMWDCGTQPLNTVIITFVFSVYITGSAFSSENDTSIALLVSTMIAGLIVAVLAPVLGQASDRTGRTVRNPRWQTWAIALLAACLFFVAPAPGYLWLGLGLLGVASIVGEIANVNYYALIDQVATKKDVGQVSGFGWGLGYLGGIVALMLLYFGSIAPEVSLFGVSSHDGLDIRVSMPVCAVWIVGFTIPTFVALRDTPRPPALPIGILASYRMLWASLKRLWVEDRNTARFLVASALFRDGLSGVFAFGAVLAAQTFGFSAGEVIIFGAAANVVAGVSTIGFGFLDDHIGPKRVYSPSRLRCVGWAWASSCCMTAARSCFGPWGWPCAPSSGPRSRRPGPSWPARFPMAVPGRSSVCMPLQAARFRFLPPPCSGSPSLWVPPSRAQIHPVLRHPRHRRGARRGAHPHARGHRSCAEPRLMTSRPRLPRATAG